MYSLDNSRLTLYMKRCQLVICEKGISGYIYMVPVKCLIGFKKICTLHTVTRNCLFFLAQKYLSLTLYAGAYVSEKARPWCNGSNG